MNELEKNTGMKYLTSLEYSGLENLFQRIVSAYEDYLRIPIEDQTPAAEITRRTDTGIDIFDGAHNLYVIEGFAIKSIFVIDDQCVMAGFSTMGKDPDDCFNNDPDTLIDITPFLDMRYIDIIWLIYSIYQIED